MKKHALGFADEWRANGFELQGPLKKNHKEEALDIGAEACYVKHCRSVRPAFVLEAHKVDEVIDLMYIYVPMGLERESALQGSILARFCSHELASCFLEVASEQLEMRYDSNACTVAIPENARRHGTRSVMERIDPAACASSLLRYRAEPNHTLGCERLEFRARNCYDNSGNGTCLGFGAGRFRNDKD